MTLQSRETGEEATADVDSGDLERHPDGDVNLDMEPGISTPDGDNPLVESLFEGLGSHTERLESLEERIKDLEGDEFDACPECGNPIEESAAPSGTVQLCNRCGQGVEID